MEGTDHQSLAVASGENPEEDEAEQDDDAQYGGDGSVDRQVAHGCQAEVDEDGGEPEPEMGEEVHHRIEDDTRGGLLAADVLGEFEDAVGLASEAANGGGVVEGIAGDGEAVDAKEGYPFSRPPVSSDLRQDDLAPGEGVDAVDDDPDAYNGDEPVAGMTDMLPEFDETDVEGEEHDYHGCQAEEEEEVVEALLGHVSYVIFVYSLRFTVYS